MRRRVHTQRVAQPSPQPEQLLRGQRKRRNTNGRQILCAQELVFVLQFAIRKSQTRRLAMTYCKQVAETIGAERGGRLG